MSVHATEVSPPKKKKCLVTFEFPKETKKTSIDVTEEEKAFLNKIMGENIPEETGDSDSNSSVETN
jgi:hypothetical protein